MFPPKLSASAFHVGSADPVWPPLATAFVWVSAWWVLMSDRSVPGLDWSVWSGLWAFFVGVLTSRNFTECYILQKYEFSKTFCVGVQLARTYKY